MLYALRISKQFSFRSAVAALLVLSSPAVLRSGASVESMYRDFVTPPGDARIMMRWWWFGPAVEKGELERELLVMKQAGIGGVEIQPVYPLELDDPTKGFRNTPYLSEEFLDDVRFVSAKAKELGLRVDITLGSGWPYGGPDTPVTEAAGRLRVERFSVGAGERSWPIPALQNGERLIAAFADGVQLKEFEHGRAILPANARGSLDLVFFAASRTGQQVKRPGVGAEGFVLDHYSRPAVEHHLRAVADPLMQAFANNLPHAVFSDSLEVFGSDWTDNFLTEFQKRRGYDLIPYLPALVENIGPKTAAIRHDWGETLTELADENYLIPIREWAHAHHTLFRSQTYGEPPVEMSANDLVDLPEGEHGPEWRAFSAARWASSACHLFGRPVTSTETWTWLHAPSFRATPLDMKAEADLHFLEGINQLIGHGWPYSPPSAGEPGWHFYASGALNDHNPWFMVMPELARYLQRVSFLTRQGEPANDVAIYLPTDDAWAHFDGGFPDKGEDGFQKTVLSIDEQMDTLLGPNLIPQVLNSGYNFDFIDDAAIARAGIRHRILILPGVERMSPQTLRRVSEFSQAGGVVLATRRLPALAPGLMDEKDTPVVEKMARELFSASTNHARFVEDEQTLGIALHEALKPDFEVESANASIGFIHRKSASTASDQGAAHEQRYDIYFVANTSNDPVHTEAKIRLFGEAPESWDPFNGQRRLLRATSDGQNTQVALDLEPYQSEIIVFSPGKPRQPEALEEPSRRVRDISTNWLVTFKGLARKEDMNDLRSWTDNPETEYYSGQAVYEKTVDLPDSFLQGARSVQLDFGKGQALPATHAAFGMRALLESPVRESALVFVNGQLAGSIWHPPYAVDVSKRLRAGRNEIRVVVANLAINEMAGRARPTYKLLIDRYGERFRPQGFENLLPVTAGMLGPVSLIAR